MQTVYDGVTKGTKDVMVDQMVEDATRALKAVADKLWVLWADHLIPNMAH